MKPMKQANRPKQKTAANHQDYLVIGCCDAMAQARNLIEAAKSVLTQVAETVEESRQLRLEAQQIRWVLAADKAHWAKQLAEHPSPT